MATTKLIYVSVGLAAAVGAALLLCAEYKNPRTHTLSVNQPVTMPGPVRVIIPPENQVVKSPLSVIGIAPGNWFFEASLPVSLVDEAGTELARAPAQAQTEWMVMTPVEFRTSLTFTTPASSTGYLVVENDNPSGLPELSKSFRVKVRFR
jgi:hypothetical protein